MHLILLLVSLLSGFTPFGSAAPLHISENATAVLWADTVANGQDVGDQDYCSAVQVSGTGNLLTLVTAGHCLSTDETENLGDDKIHIHRGPTRVQFFDGQEGRVVTSQTSKYDDIGFITVHVARRHPFIASFGNLPYRGEHLSVFGDPNGNLWSFQQADSTQGAVFYGLDPWKYTYPIECVSCGPGDSGAGVWNDAGHLLGIVVAGDTENGGVTTLIVPVQRFEAALDGRRL